jgi:hypothetical protein
MTQACEIQRAYVDPELIEGTAPPDSGLGMVRGLLYRRHGLECPKCQVVTLRCCLTDVKAAFGKKAECGMCGTEWIYRWSPL